MATGIRIVDGGSIRTTDNNDIRIVDLGRAPGCPTKNECPDEFMTNYSSESLELNTYYGIKFGADGCIGRCTSVISQADADLCAQRQLVECEEENSEDPTGVLFENTPQEFSVSCPNGTTFTYRVPAGVFTAATQAEADAQALSYAQQQAPLNLLCLGPLSACCCVNTGFDQTCPAEGAERDLAFEVISGALPTGLELVGGDMEFQIVGTPTIAGSYSFTISATDENGNTADKAYLLNVVGIFDDSLPDFEVGVPYSHQLSAIGGSGNYAWKVSSGELPPGLEMSITGLISGTPTGGSSTAITFQVIDLGCTSADKTFFPPRISLSTVSTVRIATVIGYPEFAGHISTPPKKYKKITWSGTSEQEATWLGSLNGIDYTGVNAARARYEYSGTGEISDAGAQISNYTKNLFQACPSATQWPRNISVIPNFGFTAIKGYCWPDDPNSCTECQNPPQFSGNVASNSINDWSDFIGGSSFVQFNGNIALNHSTREGIVLTSGGVNVPTTDINDVDGPWMRVTGTHAIDVVLEEEYTDAIALANARTYNSNGNTAEATPRTTGYVSKYVDVAYALTCTNLVIGEAYTVSVRLYNTKTGVSTIRTYTFDATATTEVINDTVPTPTAGQPLQVRSPQIAFTP